MSVTTVEPAPGDLFQWPTAEDDQGLVLVISPRPPCQPLSWEKPVIDFTTCPLAIASRPLVGQVVFHFCWSYWPVGILWRQNRWKFHEIFQDKKKNFCQ